MTTTITFDGLTLSNPEPWSMTYRPNVKEHMLLTGRTILQTATTYGLAIGFKCHTESYSEITNVIGKFGKIGTLVLDGASFTDCAIFNFSVEQFVTGKYEYEVGFYKMTGATV